MKKSTSLIFFGTEDFSTTSLIRLVEAGWLMAAVVTKPDSPRGRGQKLAAPDIKRVAEKLHIKVLQPAKAEDIQAALKNLRPEWGVLVAYGKIIPAEVLDLFDGGIVNAHPSLLPAWRGPAPIEAAILNGDRETGVSLIKLAERMDAGPVYRQKVLLLSGKENRLQLRTKLAEESAGLLSSSLPGIIDGTIKPQPQDEIQATYTHLIDKGDGVIDWGRPAESLERKIRAYAGYPKSRAKLFDKHEVVVLEARVAENAADGSLVLECHPGWLEIKRLIAPSGRVMSGAEFLRGYRKD